MELSPFSEALFFFCNKAGDKVKVLCWNKMGFCLWYKRLEKERFKWPLKYPQSVMNLSEEKWQSFMSGNVGELQNIILGLQQQLREEEVTFKQKIADKDARITQLEQNY